MSVPHADCTCPFLGVGQGAIPATAYPQQAPGPEASYPQASSQYQQPSASQYPDHSGAAVAAGAIAGAAAAAGAVAGGDNYGQVADMQPQSSGQNNKDWVRLVYLNYACRLRVLSCLSMLLL